MSSLARTFIVILILSICQLAFGQGGRGGWGRRGQRGGGDTGSGQDAGGGRFQGRGRDSSGGPGPGGGRDANSPPSGDDIAQRVARTETFLKGLDTNGNGMIDPEEASDPSAKGMLDRIFSRIGKEPHYPIAIKEITQGYEAFYRSGGSSSTPGTPSASSPTGTKLAGASPSGAATPAQGSASSPAASSTADAKSTPRKPSRFPTARERLPKGLPDWFLRLDVNGEGQITMSQYVTKGTQDEVEEFARYDLNHDGIITAAECLKVEKGKADSK